MQLKSLMRAGGAVATLAAAGSVAVPAVASASTTLIGQGSTLVAPLASEWTAAYTLTQGNYALSYTPSSSGNGIKYTEGATPQDQFGGSDMPLSGTTGAYALYPNGVEQLPWALTATGVAYNLSGVKLPKGQSTLNLSGTVLAKIYTGAITNWNDPAIKALNPKATIPSTTITPVLRSGSSGDSYAFESFMNAAAPSVWNYTPAGTWPVSNVGVAESGNSGLAAEVQQTNGAVGYVAVPYLYAAGAGNLKVAAIQNAAGRFEYPNEGNIADAALSNSTPQAQGASFGMGITYPSAKYKYAYPISTFTYAILPMGQGSTITPGLQGFVDYAVTSGQNLAAALGFVPLAKESYPVDYGAVTTTKIVKKKVGKKIKKVKVTKTVYKYAATISVDLSPIASYDEAQVGSL